MRRAGFLIGAEPGEPAIRVRVEGHGKESDVRCVFVGTVAFLGRIDGDTRCAFWAGEPVDHGFDPKLLVDVDLAMTPSAAAARRISWREVQVEDCFSGPNGAVGGTTLGPRWPELRLAGAVYLEREHWRALPDATRPPCPPEGAAGRAYEYMSVLYRPDRLGPRAGNRYSGHHAEILEERGSLVHVAVSPPGRSQDPGVEPTRMWIDLASAAQCDAGPGSLTMIGPGDAPKQGALFLISGRLPAVTASGGPR
jgi:hypothetical protein